MFATPETLAHLAAPWAKFYSHSKVASTLVTFLHIAPIVVGGGLGIALDRSTLRLRHDDPGARERYLAELGASHRVVITALAVSFLSGIAHLAADLDTFLGSWVFWAKMALIVLPLVNGGVMTRVEAQLRRGATGEVPWRRLRGITLTSLTLWLTVTFTGVVLTAL